MLTCFALALVRSADYDANYGLTERFLTAGSLDTAVLYVPCWTLTGNVSVPDHSTHETCTWL